MKVIYYGSGEIYMTKDKEETRTYQKNGSVRSINGKDFYETYDEDGILTSHSDGNLSKYYYEDGKSIRTTIQYLKRDDFSSEIATNYDRDGNMMIINTRKYVEPPEETIAEYKFSETGNLFKYKEKEVRYEEEPIVDSMMILWELCGYDVKTFYESGKIESSYYEDKKGQKTDVKYFDP